MSPAIRTRNQLILLFAPALLFFGLTNCNKPTPEVTKSSGGGTTATTPAGTDAKAANQALVRFINATPDIKDLTFGELKAFPAIPARSVSAYQLIPSERHEFRLLSPGKADLKPLATNSESPAAGLHYSILGITNEDGTNSLKVLNDDSPRPATGKAKVRVVHAASGVEKLDAYSAADKDPFISGIAFNTATNYKEVSPATMELDLRVEGSKKNLMNIKEVRLDPDKFYTIVLFGGHGQPPTAKVIEDQLVAK